MKVLVLWLGIRGEYVTPASKIRDDAILGHCNTTGSFSIDETSEIRTDKVREEAQKLGNSI